MEERYKAVLGALTANRRHYYMVSKNPNSGPLSSDEQKTLSCPVSRACYDHHGVSALQISTGGRPRTIVQTTDGQPARELEGPEDVTHLPIAQCNALPIHSLKNVLLTTLFFVFCLPACMSTPSETKNPPRTVLVMDR